jgi:hypothetical protein
MSLGDMEIALDVPVEGYKKTLNHRIISVEHTLGLIKLCDAGGSEFGRDVQHQTRRGGAAPSPN